MKSYSSREIIKILEKNGWYLKRIVGDHYQYTDGHRLATIRHPVKDLGIKNVKSIQKQTGIKFK
ncbi:MAG: type II toxin-antitoxin system HicA family toxin [Clostridium tyrobutyricum]|jgi:predicted RNA binding protein YcfA (HicA-like mRNA interferase family)|uniref:type II toxin-antitoxin system HicA family toxin n=1 Tax=Clostridium tyrobutyricum TaxID=1519 RepID=UPI00242E5F27|nr:type II toxin-antitoxin system HicA family toxin [Clostridium tyrobutyricum]MCH4200161.1 type II toxin-antitoxin system HicA family toxin [Clostridium tyrobutyricum]MCH4237905.1 type II toxin-antitoxin system HicA family toxin [Clostridium tyrobutyricum]MCH4259729.1 type II toxin-antitoxin system HicA family toxin [Clostridium tyrobutyricum]